MGYNMSESIKPINRAETLGQKQRRLTLMLAKLILFIHDQGFEASLGDAYRDPRVFGVIGVQKGYGRSQSCHKLRLALDLNLFKDGVFLDSTEAHAPFGAYWESIGGSWGGRFEDGNHYSLEHQGRR